MSRRTSPADAGFTILEVLVANAILTIGLVSLAQVLAMTVAANAAAGRLTYVALLASQKIEDATARPWLAAATAEAGVDHLDRGGRSARDAGAPAVFTRSWAATPLAADPAGTLVIESAARAGPTEARLVAVRTRTKP